LAGESKFSTGTARKRQASSRFSGKRRKWNELGKLAQKYYADYQHITSWSMLLNLLEENNSNWWLW
jgi:hypothetical protein